MKTRYLFLVIFIQIVIVAVSCKTNAPTSTGNSTGNTSGKNFKLAFVTNNASDYWTIARKGVEKADAELNDVTVDFRLPGEGTAAEQKRIIDDLVSTRPPCTAPFAVDCSGASILTRCRRSGRAPARRSRTPRRRTELHGPEHRLAKTRLYSFARRA